MIRIAAAALIILAFGFSAYTISTFIRNGGQTKSDSKPSANESSESPGDPHDFSAPLGLAESRQPIAVHQPVPVALNRGPEISEGFRGEVHALLFGKTRLEVTADWTPVSKGRDQLHSHLNALVYSWFTELRPARPRQTYSERDFSAFLPRSVEKVGQIWELDGGKIAEILKQFHPRPSMHLVATGRRAGPDGTFAILRAMSPDYLDIAFRIHAEFYLTPPDLPPGLVDAWYTPAFFSGSVVVNQRTGTVDYFRLALATDKALNVHLTVSSLRSGTEPHDIVRVERMELAGGDRSLEEKIPWVTALTFAEAEKRLAKIFYKSLEIDWMPVDRALVEARRQGRPIFALVSWGATDDQSC
jgi:hypothetical protein